MLQGLGRHQRMHRPDREVDLTPPESTFEVDARPLDQVQPYFGRKASRDLREQPRRRTRVGAEPDVTPCRREIAEPVQDLLGVRQQGPPFRRQGGRVRSTVEELDAEGLLELGDVLADPRLGAEGRLGRGREAAVPGDRDEADDPVQAVAVRRGQVHS